MKLIKVKAYFQRSDDGQGGITTVFRGGYPPEWDAEKIPFILYMDKDEGVDPDGRTFQWVVATVPDNLYDKMIQNTRQCSPISSSEAIAYGEKYFPRNRKIIADRERVIKILEKLLSDPALKQQIDLKLTLEERDCLDADKPQPGIHWAKSAVDIWKERYGVPL